MIIISMTDGLLNWLTHSIIHDFETVPNLRKLQTTTEMWLIKDFKIQIAKKKTVEKGAIAHLFPHFFPKTFFLQWVKTSIYRGKGSDTLFLHYRYLLWRRMSCGTIFYSVLKRPYGGSHIVCWVPALFVTKLVRPRLLRLGLHDTSFAINDKRSELKNFEYLLSIYRTFYRHIDVLFSCILVVNTISFISPSSLKITLSTRFLGERYKQFDNRRIL